MSKLKVWWLPVVWALTFILLGAAGNIRWNQMRVGVGMDGQVFTSNSKAASGEGVDWETSAGGGNVSASGTLTSGSIVIGQGSTNVAAASSFTQCGANNYATGITAAGAANCAQVAYSQVSGTPAVGMVLIEQHTASSSSELDFTSCLSNSSYDQFYITWVNLLPATDGVSLRMRMSTNGGSSYDTGSNYSWSLFFAVNNATAANGSDSDTSFEIAGSVKNSSSAGSTNGFVQIGNPASTSLDKNLFGQSAGASSTNSGKASSQTLALQYFNTSAVNAFNVFFSSGNLASGTVRCYGMAK